MVDKVVALTREEQYLVADALADNLEGDMAGVSREDATRAWRLLVKLDKALGKEGAAGFMWELPWGVRQQLHRTYAPDKAPAARRSAPKPAGGARPAGSKISSPTRKAPAAASAARGAGQAIGSSSDGAEDLAAAHAAVNKSHRSAAEKAEAHKALNAAAAAR